MENKSSAPSAFHVNTPPVQESPNIKVDFSKPNGESGGGTPENYPQRKGVGDEGPGMGHLKTMASDDQMPGQSYP